MKAENFDVLLSIGRCRVYLLFSAADDDVVHIVVVVFIFDLKNKKSSDCTYDKIFSV